MCRCAPLDGCFLRHAEYVEDNNIDVDRVVEGTVLMEGSSDFGWTRGTFKDIERKDY